MSEKQQPIIEVNKLSKHYTISHLQKAAYGSIRDDITGFLTMPLSLFGHRSEDKEVLKALDKVSFAVDEGDIIGIIGSNGSGKSTLLKILSRIVEPSGGEAILRGRVASLLEVGTGFHPELTGRENVYLNGAILGMSKREIESKFDEIVAFSGVERFLDTPVKFYSSGMYVRLAFAVAAHLEPDILIVDEVLAVGDAQFQKKSLGKMNSVAREGRTVIFVSHNMNAIEQLCTKVLHLHEGEVVEFGSDVGGIIRSYLSQQGLAVDSSAEWANSDPASVTSQYFRPAKLSIVNAAGKPLKMPITRTAEAWVQIQGEILKPDDLLTLGYAIYQDDGTPLFWSYQTDVPKSEWTPLKKGKIKLRSQLPPRFLNEGRFKIELIASIHFKEWLFRPGMNAPYIYLQIHGEMSDSPYWTTQRPGPISPVIPWVIEQGK